jgi:hypothetical protein
MPGWILVPAALDSGLPEIEGEIPPSVEVKPFMAMEMWSWVLWTRQLY